DRMRPAVFTVSSGLALCKIVQMSNLSARCSLLGIADLLTVDRATRIDDEHDVSVLVLHTAHVAFPMAVIDYRAGASQFGCFLAAWCGCHWLASFARKRAMQRAMAGNL